MHHTTKNPATNLKDDAKRHQLIQDQHDRGAGQAGTNNSMGYPTDDRQDTEMVCGGSPVVLENGTKTVGPEAD